MASLVRGGLVQRHDEALARIDRRDDFEIAQPQLIAVEEPPRHALADGLTVAVEVDAVGARVEQVVDSAPVIDCRVAPGNVTERIGQNPVVLQRAADRAALLIENTHGIVADDVAVFADNFETQGHDRRIVQRFRASGCYPVHIIAVSPQTAAGSYMRKSAQIGNSTARARKPGQQRRFWVIYAAWETRNFTGLCS